MNKADFDGTESLMSIVVGLSGAILHLHPR